MVKHNWYAYSLAIPAFRTAELTAFTAVCMLLRSCVKSPVASGTLRCSSKTNLVKVMQLESNAGPVDVIFTAVASRGTKLRITPLNTRDRNNS